MNENLYSNLPYHRMGFDNPLVEDYEKDLKKLNKNINNLIEDFISDNLIYIKQYINEKYDMLHNEQNDVWKNRMESEFKRQEDLYKQEIEDLKKIIAELIKYKQVIIENIESNKKIDIDFFENGFSGVYILYQDEEVVYVGQSRFIFNRIQTHILDRDKKFNYVEFMFFPKDRLDDLEMFLIKKHKPKYNKIGLK